MLITLVLVVLIIGGYFAIRSNQAKNEIKNQIISTMENAIDRGIYIGEVENYSLNSITLSNFKIFKNRSLLDEDQIFEAEEIIVNYDLDILSALKKKTALNIEDITLIKPRMTLIRDSQGIFDFMEKFNFNSANFAVSLKRVNFQDGNLDYIDFQTTKEDGLLTKVKSLNGYFYLENLPKVEFDCSGLREEDDAPLAIKGYFFADRGDYSLDFNFKDADITHFQYYFAETKPFNLKKGLFDLNLHLANDSDTTKGETIWHGQASARDVDLFPDFLNGIELNQAEGSATFDSKETIIEKVTALYKNSPFTLKGNLAYVDEFNYNIRVKSDDFKLSDLKEGLKEYLSLASEVQAEGKSNLSFEASGSGKIFQVQGELSTEQGEIQGYDFSHLRTEFNYDQDIFYFQNLKAEVEGGVVEGTGKSILKDELFEYDILFNLVQVDVESNFLKSLHLDYLKRGLLSGKVEIRGIIAQGEKINLSAEAKVKNEAGVLSLKAEGVIAENNYLDLKVNTVGINLEEMGEILSYQEIKGLANFTGELSGPPDDPKIKGKIEAREGQISELPFDYLEGKIDYQSSKLKLEELVFKNEGLGLEGNGSIDFTEGKDTETNFVFKVEQANIGYLAKFYNYDFSLSGMAQGEITVEGIWPKLNARGDLGLKDINLVSFKAESGNLIFVLEDNKIRVENMVLNSGKTQLYAQGEINLEEDLPLNLRVNFLNQDISYFISNFVQSDLNLINRFRGKATGSLEIKGNYASPDLYLSALIEDAQLEGVPLNSIEVKLDKIGSMVRINQLKLSQRKGQLTAGGWINFDEGNKNLDIHLSADNVDLSQLSNLFGIEDEIGGIVNFKAEVTGGIYLPNISFSAKVEKGKFQDFIFDNLTFEALYNQDILEVKQFAMDKGGHQIKGKGKIPYKFSSMGKEKVTSSLTDVPIDFVLTLEDTDLSFISMFFKEDIKQLQGLTNAELKLSGTLNQPILNGSIVLADGEVELFQFPTKINDLNVFLQLEDNLIKIEDMNFQIEQYTIYTSGEFALKNLQPQDLNINIWSNKEEILYQDIFQAQADLKAKVTGLFTSPHIEGILTLSQAELNWKDNNKDVPNDPSALLSKLINLKGDINLEVKILDDFMAKANDFNLKLAGGLKVQGSLSAPKLNGELDIKQGYVTFLDKNFRVTEGKVIFADSTGEDIILDIRAKTEIDDIDVFLNVSGILAQPTITLSSSPVLSESEIISLLMFNKNYAGLTEGEMGTILQEEMINLIAQGLSIRFLNQIENQVADSLGLDEFKIETIFKEEQDSDFSFFPGLALETLAFKVGKYFSESFYLTYSAPLFEMGIGDLGLEYKLKDDLTLSTQIGSVSSQDDEFELKFELQYEF